ncbi:MAG: phosphatase PAP2 family protein [Bacteroidota bacterium]
MKNIIIIILASQFLAKGNDIGKKITLDKLEIVAEDSVKNPKIMGGGILMFPIEISFTRKSQVNFTAPIIVTGTGMLLISSSMKRAQTDWYKEKIKGKSTMVDDYLAIAPNALALGLSIIGAKPKHKFKDRLLVAAMANSMSLGLTYGLKYTTKIKRPDNSDNYSFPSAHTAFAFAGAQIMHEEYGEQSIIYSILGYGIGATVGGLRMVNNAHWLSDVVAGAGIGMLSTKLAYRLLPWAQKKMYKNENLAILPVYYPKGAGFGMTLSFK